MLSGYHSTRGRLRVCWGCVYRSVTVCRIDPAGTCYLLTCYFYLLRIRTFTSRISGLRTEKYFIYTFVSHFMMPYQVPLVYIASRDDVQSFRLRQFFTCYVITIPGSCKFVGHFGTRTEHSCGYPFNHFIINTDMFVCLFVFGATAPVGQGLLIHEVSRSR